MSRWLAIVGIGEDGLDGLGAAARALIGDAKLLVGGKRHLAMIPADGRPRIAWTSQLAAQVDEIVERRGEAVCILASGDPMFYGIGATLAKRVPADEMTIVPAPSSFSLACARLGWAMAEVTAISLHGRPLALLNGWLQPGARLLALSEDRTTPAAAAALLRARGYGGSRFWVLEHLGGPKERVIPGRADDWQDEDIADLNIVAIDCAAGEDAMALPRLPGLPDEAFRHDGQLTKREMRAITLASLAPLPGQLLWDVGAGCGSISIEWMRCQSGTRAVAIESDESRRRLIADNALSLGTPNLEIVAGQAPEALAGLAPPDAVFIGGGGSMPGLFEACWSALKPGGRLVANGVTLEGEARLFAWRARVGGELTRIAVERAAPIGRYTSWQPFRAVTQFAAVKP